ncbi:MAG: hypothetical protein M1823_001551 [Watsoniomyces obsoletus]|nr:MAG: hypothetical protein M1823_001551 [Watsoniomyces obsoletus]
MPGGMLAAFQYSRLRPLRLRRILDHWKPSGHVWSRPSSNSTVALLQDEDSLRAAKEWLTTFDISSIPKNSFTLTFSRASGPGGQNVNKVNSKVTLRMPMDRLLPLVPPALHGTIRDSRFYAAKSNSIVLQADQARHQQDNIEICVRKLYEMLVDAGRTVIPGSTSAEQKERVKKLQATSKERRLQSKKVQGNKKAGRRDGSRTDD